MNSFFGQMVEFEKMKQGVVEVENTKLDMLRQQIEQEGADSDGDFKMEDILGMIPSISLKIDVIKLVRCLLNLSNPERQYKKLIH